MMKARFLIEEPREVTATLKLTMTIKEWEEMRDQLTAAKDTIGTKYHLLTSLSGHISNLIIQARKVFYSEYEDEK